MVKESEFQPKVIKWLKEQGCYVIKNSAVSGVPTGCPDIVFFKEGFYGFLEVKRTAKSPFQPLQKETLAKLDNWSWAKAVYPENWSDIQKELAVILHD
jgi:Holliday junction resolvase